MTTKCGYVLLGPLAGHFWEINLIEREHYVLTIGDAFYSSADNQRELLDEVTALDNRPR